MTPWKFVSIPQLDLVAVVLAVKISALIKKELEMEELIEYFWTDRKVVLGYIVNDSRVFKTFVANRVQAIQEHSSPTQWNYIPSENNLARDDSRGMTFKVIFLSFLGGFRVQHVYGNHDQVGRSLQLKEQIKMIHLIWNERSR